MEAYSFQTSFQVKGHLISFPEPLHWLMAGKGSGWPSIFLTFWVTQIDPWYITMFLKLGTTDTLNILENSVLWGLNCALEDVYQNPQHQ